MKLLLPDFNTQDIQTTNGSSPHSRPAKRSPSADEAPCCSKDLRDGGSGGVTQEGETSRGEEKSPGEEKEARSNGMERKEVTEEENREEKKKEDEEEGSTDEEEEEDDGDDEDRRSFIRNTGLVSHTYSLDLNITQGGYSSRSHVKFVKKDKKKEVNSEIQIHLVCQCLRSFLPLFQVFI